MLLALPRIERFTASVLRHMEGVYTDQTSSNTISHRVLYMEKNETEHNVIHYTLICVVSDVMSVTIIQLKTFQQLTILNSNIQSLEIKYVGSASTDGNGGH